MELKNIPFFIVVISFLVILSRENNNSSDTEELLFKDDFTDSLSQWTVEQMPGGEVKITDGKLEINDKDGCTVWFNNKLIGDIRIEYDVVLVDEDGTNDRVSDLNCFWKAIDPSSPDDIFANSRTGKFANYHCFRLYYVGFGANNNTTTRFRRYPGDCSRPMLPEHDLSDPDLMNIPNMERHVQITCVDSQTVYKIDTMTVFDFTDDEPFLEGWFGFRTVANHMTIDNFKVYALKNK